MPSTSTLPAPIQDRLSSARVRLRTVDIGLGVARAILAVSVALVALFALDTALEPPLLVLRGFALFVSLLAAAAATVFLARPLRRTLTDDDVALLVERENPELGDALVSAVQLSRQLDAPDLYTSRALIRSTIDRTASRVETVDFGRVVRTGPLIPLSVLIVAFLALGGLLLRHPTIAEYAGIFYRRVVLGDPTAMYPKLVKLRVLLEGTDLAVAKGDDLTVDVQVEQGANLVEKLVVKTQYVTKAPDGSETRTLEERELGSADRLLYRKSYQNITDGFSFWIEDDQHDVSTPTYTVRVVQRPRIERYELVLQYPDYIGKPTEAVTQPDLQVPAGTEITFVAVANKPLAEAALRFEYDRRPAAGSREKPAPEAQEGPKPAFLGDLPGDAFAQGGPWAPLAASVQRLKVSAAEDGRRVLVGRFRVSKDVRFHFYLLSKEEEGHGYDNGKKPVAFSVTALADQRPVVNVPVPGRRKQVTPKAKLPLVIEAHDDYGVASLALRYRIERPGEAAQRPLQTVALPLPQGAARQVKVEWALDMADLQVQPGDLIHYVAVATDKNIDESLREAESRSYEVQVVRPEDLERILQDRLQALKDRLEAAAKEETDARTGTAAFATELGPKDVFTDDDKRRLQRFDQDQRRVTQRIEEILAELTDIAQERALNRLSDEAAAALVEDLSGAVRDLAKEKSPLISRELDDARAATRVDERVRTRLARVPDLQQQVADALTALAARIGKWGDFTEVIQELRDLMQGQERVIDGTKQAAQDQH
jgi:hypothetical protein